MKNSDKVIFLQLILGNIIFVVIGTVLLSIGTSKSIVVSFTELFSLDGIVFSFICGLIGSLATCLYVSIVIKAGKGNLPNTEGSNAITQLSNNKLFSLIGLVIFPSIVEEFLFRGVIQYYLVEIFNPFWGIVISAFIFMLAHISDQYKGQPFLLFHIFWLGIVTGVAFMMTESLWASIMIHLINNYWSVKNIRSRKIEVKVEN